MIFGTYGTDKTDKACKPYLALLSLSKPWVISWVMSFDYGCCLIIFALGFVVTHPFGSVCCKTIYQWVCGMKPLPCKCCGIKTIALFFVPFSERSDNLLGMFLSCRSLLHRHGM